MLHTHSSVGVSVCVRSSLGIGKKNKKERRPPWPNEDRKRPWKVIAGLLSVQRAGMQVG